MDSSLAESGSVETLYSDYVELIRDVEQSNPSGMSSLNAVYSKLLLIAAASNLESEVKLRLGAAVTRRGGFELAELVRHAVLSRGYHTLVDWKTGDAKKLFSSFGKDAKERFSTFRKDEECEARQRAFVELGNERNKLVHNDFASYALDKTPDEIIALYHLAVDFVANIEDIAFGETHERGA